MRLATSNIALTAHNHDDELRRLPALGIEAIEVAPSRVWGNSWDGLTANDVASYRRTVEQAGLSVVGLHSLFYDQPTLGLFRDDGGRRRTLEFLAHLSGMCRDLGGRTLIWGGGRRREDVAADAAIAETIDFMSELCARIEDHGTVFCFEPLGPENTDFINSALESLAIVEAVDHPALAVQLDAKALVQNDEAAPGTFRSVAHRLVHYHANEPDLGVLGTSGEVDHAALGGMLGDVGYVGFVSIEQRLVDPDDVMGPIAASAARARECYGG